MNFLTRLAMPLALSALMLGACCPAWGQHTGGGGAGSTPSVPSTSQPANSPSLGGVGADDAMRERTAHMELEMEKSRNSERQKKLVADTEKLLTLANELKVDVDKSTKDTLSLEVIRKADEIEKLARSVRERMKAS